VEVEEEGMGTRRGGCRSGPGRRTASTTSAPARAASVTAAATTTRAIAAALSLVEVQGMQQHWIIQKGRVNLYASIT
jgi:hypothetical protein